MNAYKDAAFRMLIPNDYETRKRYLDYAIVEFNKACAMKSDPTDEE